MSGPVSSHVRRNRSITGRKAAEAKKQRALRMAEMAPDGALRGSAPVDGGVSGILERIRAGGRQEGG